ncbi:BQ2448_425 [Microbotryum intermedium]|uniref:BQ2448_425 protein n=1 Tax=Microbotryum intermedium TaxID=269621 RepID=A0A238F8U5_9BASI|nr:BQ2448_425 [Microbotryum intermedium]
MVGQAQVDSATQATSLEFKKAYDQAFSLYLQSAQSYLYLIRHCADPHQKEQLRSINRGLLERATRIKDSGKLDTNSSGAATGLGPTGNGNGNSNGNGKGRERLSLEEQDSVLERSSKFNGKRFERSRSSPIVQPSLASTSTSYKRPLPSIPVVVPERLSGLDIVQDNVGDCSLVSALIVCAQHASRFGTKLALDCLYPKDAKGWPCRSVEGVYEAKFWLNGLWRRVGRYWTRTKFRDEGSAAESHFWIIITVFDDHLPHSTIASEPMFATTSHRDQLWPALIEKAVSLKVGADRVYMTLMSTYDFAGSNSGIDVHTLTGWIPEHISLMCVFMSHRVDACESQLMDTDGQNTPSSNFRSEKTWQRLVKGWKSGSCVLTLGTGTSPREGWESRHSYAVTDLTETKDGHRQVRVVNPWRAAMWSRGLLEGLPDSDEKRDRESIDVDWDTIANWFEAIHVNWDPKEFENTSIVQCSIPGPSTKPVNEPPGPRSTRLRLRLASNPTFPAEVWILLSRHRSIANDQNEFIGLHVVKTLTGGVEHGRSEEFNSHYTDNPFLLYRFLADPSTLCYELFISHRASTLDDTRFTLVAFAPLPVSIEEGPVPLAYSKQIESLWTSKTAGGNHSCPSFFNNPQWSIRLVAPLNKPNARAVLNVIAETSKDVSINVKLVRNRGERIDRLEERDVLAGSSTYTYGISSLRLVDLEREQNILASSLFFLEHGSDLRFASCTANTAYTVIVSSFAPDALGTFKLSIHSDMSIVAEAIPAEGAGMYARIARGQWSVRLHAKVPAEISLIALLFVVRSSTEDSSRGNVIPHPHEQRWKIGSVDKTTRLILRLQALEPPIGLSLVLLPIVDGEGATGPAIATTGVFSDAVCGVVIRVMKLPAKTLGKAAYSRVASRNELSPCPYANPGYVAVARTSSGRLEQPVDFRLLLYADQAVTFTSM